jgi:hypothetical protein
MKHPYGLNGVITIADNLRLRAEVDQLRRERDEARREVCESEQYCVDRSREEAARRGWDCYKEKNHDTE